MAKTLYEIRQAPFGWIVVRDGRNLFGHNPPLIGNSSSAYRLAREDAEQNRPADIVVFEDGMEERTEIA